MSRPLFILVQHTTHPKRSLVLVEVHLGRSELARRHPAIEQDVKLTWERPRISASSKYATMIQAVTVPNQTYPDLPGRLPSVGLSIQDETASPIQRARAERNEIDVVRGPGDTSRKRPEPDGRCLGHDHSNMNEMRMPNTA
jgi:hypothetical protein